MDTRLLSGPLPSASAVRLPLASTRLNRADQLDQWMMGQPDHENQLGLAKNLRASLSALFVPKNVATTMTKDYVPTRWWWLGRELMGSLSYGFAAGQASAVALELLIKAQPGMSVATVGLGLGMYWFPKVVEQIRNGTSMATSTVAEVADRRPKAYFLAGDILDNVGTAVLSCAALMPTLYAPITIGVGMMQTVAGVIKGRAQANMNFRQALNPRDTLPEVNTKQGNQIIALNLVSLLAGAGMQMAIGGTALAASLPMVGCATAALAVFATSRYLAHLDMENINESVVRQVVERLEGGQEVPAPQRDRVWKNLKTLGEQDTLELGQHPTRLKQAGQKRYQQLLELYRGRNYLLESLKGKPYVVLKLGASKEDCLLSMVQAIQVERLATGLDYQNILDTQGSDAADFWLTERSLQKVQEQGPGLMKRLQERGWATDLINFRDTGARFTCEELSKPLAAGQLALP